MGQRFGVGSESFQLRIERQHPAMGVSTGYRNSEYLPRQDVRGAGTTTQVCCPARGHRLIDALCSPQSELDDRFATGGQANPRRLCCNERREVQQVEERRFQQLSLENRALYTEQRFLGKY